MTSKSTNISAKEADNPIPLRQNVQDAIRRYLSNDELKLYTLIRKAFTAP